MTDLLSSTHWTAHEKHEKYRLEGKPARGLPQQENSKKSARKTLRAPIPKNHGPYRYNEPVCYANAWKVDLLHAEFFRDTGKFTRLLDRL